MHPHANALVLAWWVRHLHSTAVKFNTYFGAASKPSEMGEAQLPHLARALQALEFDAILCSPMIRATYILKESLIDLALQNSLEAAIAEWPRASSMMGMDNDDPKVQEYLDDRIRRFGPKEPVLSGEESFEETVHLMGLISEKLILYGAIIRARLKLSRPARIGMLSHGNRERQWEAWVLSDGNPELFQMLFKILYKKKGLETASIVPPFWYGNFFRGGVPCWNQEAGINWYLPRELRESII